MSTNVLSQGFEYGVKHFLSSKQATALNIISETLNLPESEVEFLFELGSIYINSERADKNYVAQPDDHIRVHTRPRRYNIDYNWLERIIFENEHFIVLNKPSGIPSHPSVDNQIENSLTQTEIALNKNLFITHRLDTLTEGLIVYAKNKDFVNHFNYLLQEKRITKKYVALTETAHKFTNTHLIHYMLRTPRSPKILSAHAPHQNQPGEKWDFCELVIENQKLIHNFLWVKINLLTGRTHQIRSQLSFENAPIVGDELYGAKITLPNQIKLRAQEIEFADHNQVYHFKLDEDFELSSIET